MKLSNKLFGAFMASILISLSSSAFAFTACQVTDVGGVDDKGFNATAWKGVQDAVANLIKEAPKELTGECNVWKNYVDFPVGKI